MQQFLHGVQEQIATDNTLEYRDNLPNSWHSKSEISMSIILVSPL
jgi:hypothetical protein